MIDYRYLGASALQVSPLCLGTMMFGGPTPDDVAFRIIDRAHDEGINFIDTADVYNKGKSEEVVGRGIKAHRDDWVLATKFANMAEAGPNGGGTSRKWIYRTVEKSLKRLGTDYIDLMYFHRPCPDQPMEEGLRAVGDLIAQGKLRYFGVSNYRGWRIAEVCRLTDKLGMDRPVASQPLYNMVSRSAENEQLPAADFYGLGVVPYSPLARGVLTGKYQPGAAPPPDTRAGRGDKRLMETEWRPESLEIAHQLAEHARAKGIEPADFALAWVLNNKRVSSAITGPRTEAHWDGYMRGLEVKLDANDEALVDKLVSPGHNSTPGYNDPAYPVEGRVAR